MLNHEGASGGLSDRIVGRRQATLLIGPEPGFSDAELALARSRGVAVATLRPGRAAHRDCGDRCRRAHAAGDGVPGVSTFATEFLGCKVSLADAQAVRERLIADGHTEAESAWSG